MNKVEFLEEITNAGYSVIEDGPVLSGGTATMTGPYENWFISLAKEDGDVLTAKTYHYYVKGDGSIFWRDRSPIPVQQEVDAFRSKVDDKVATLKGGSIISYSPTAAVIKGYQVADGKASEVQYMVEDGDKITLTPLETKEISAALPII